MGSMNGNPELYKKLTEYADTDRYPFHMPGHKRQLNWGQTEEFPNPYLIDITEIEGFDNLHHPQGIIKMSMDATAKAYGADATYYLVNGSSAGILSGISGAVPDGGTILMGRNCHKAAYHGVFLRHLKTRYIYPQFMEEYGIQCGLSPEKTEKMLKEDREIDAVFVVSPTYDGIVSDIRRIADICHRYGVPLIVDEAHGAHFHYGGIFPDSALNSGADVVIQSVHKTLPCFTQSALLHIKEGYVDRERIERYLQIYQSSSPSYLLMAGIERGIRWMDGEEGKRKTEEFSQSLLELRTSLQKMKHLKILGKEVIGSKDIFDVDLSKIIISTRETGINGVQLSDRLRREYHLEMEMCTADSVTAITTVMDTKEGLYRLERALKSIDGCLSQYQAGKRKISWTDMDFEEVEQVCSLWKAWDSQWEKVPLRKSVGRTAAEFIYLYPPGIPVIAPGEQISEKSVDMILRYKEAGLSVQGMRDSESETVSVVR